MVLFKEKIDHRIPLIIEVDWSGLSVTSEFYDHRLREKDKKTQNLHITKNSISNRKTHIKNHPHLTGRNVESTKVIISSSFNQKFFDQNTSNINSTISVGIPYLNIIVENLKSLHFIST